MATITGTQRDDPLLEGTEEDDEIFGLGGDDVAFGNGGDDRILGGRQNDELRGGAGEDTLIGGPGRDRLFGGNEGDILEGGNGEDFLRGGLGRDTLRGGADRDTLRGGGDEDELFGGGGPDTLRGEGQNDMLFGDAGDDTLHGAGGIDILDGGAGDDTYVLDSAEHQIVETAETGYDTVEVEFDYALPEHVERLQLMGDAGLGVGNDEGNWLIGNDAANRLEGERGADRLQGGDGGDRLYGGNQADRLEGGNGKDRLFGGKGADILIGERGADMLTGGGGADRFTIQALADGRDIVKDFRPEQDDVLDLSQLLGNLGRGDDLDDFVQLTVERGNTVVGVNINGRGTNFKEVAVLEGIELESLSRSQLGLEPALPERRTALSRSPDGEAEGDGDSIALGVSGDGRRVIFWSDADNLSDKDGPSRDFFQADVGESNRGPFLQAALLSFGRSAAEISEDGRFVVVATDDPRISEDGTTQLVRFELETGRVAKIATTGTDPSPADISADGRYVTFLDTAADGGIGLFRWDGFDRDVARVDGPATGAGSGAISDDGNLVSTFGEGAVRNMATGEIVVSSDALNFFGDGFVPPVGRISGDGQHVFFDSAADLSVGHRDSWVYDIATGDTREVSTNATGASGDSDSQFLGASSDGRFVALHSRASNLVAGDDEGSFDLFVKDLDSGAILRVAENVRTGAISADGSAVTYSVRGENGEDQVFWAPTGFADDAGQAEAIGGGLELESLVPLLTEVPYVI